MAESGSGGAEAEETKSVKREIGLETEKRKEQSSRISTPSNPISMALIAACLNLSMYSVRRKEEAEGQSEEIKTSDVPEPNSRVISSRVNSLGMTVLPLSGMGDGATASVTCPVLARPIAKI